MNDLQCCGNIVSGKRFPTTLCPAYTPIEPPEMNSPVYRDHFVSEWLNATAIIILWQSLLKRSVSECKILFILNPENRVQTIPTMLHKRK